MNLLTTVIIVSKGRPQSLTLTLDALRHQTLPEFEVVVVGGNEEQAAIDTAGFSHEANFVAYPDANIAAARNAGVASACGEILAFIDDDAVPGPGWLKCLSTALISSNADLAAGYVRGPDGIRFQFNGSFLFADGSHEPIKTVEDNRAYEASPGRALEAMGTNVAYTRGALEATRGFDPAFSYFLDESDLNWRLARAGARTVIAPWAQVVHSLGASAQRTADRVPLTLFEIGRSTRRFLEKHFDGDIETALKTHRARHKERLLRHVRAGRLSSAGVEQVLGSFDKGISVNLVADPAPDLTKSGNRLRHLMRPKDESVRVKKLARWHGKETLTYSGGGVWVWSKPRLRITKSSTPLSSVPRFLGAQ